MSNRLENTKVVTFKEDYKLKNGKVVYAKDSVHPIHQDIAAKLKAAGVKIDIKDFDIKKETAKAKEEFEAEQKKQEGN